MITIIQSFTSLSQHMESTRARARKAGTAMGLAHEEHYHVLPSIMPG